MGELERAMGAGAAEIERVARIGRLHAVLPMLSRIIAAVVGGYALSTLAVVSLSSLFVENRAYGVLSATLPSFAIYTAAILWVFACRNAWRAWGGLAAAALVFSLIWAIGWMIGR